MPVAQLSTAYEIESRINIMTYARIPVFDYNAMFPKDIVNSWISAWNLSVSCVTCA